MTAKEKKDLRYRRMVEGDAEKVYELTKKVFDKFVAQTFERQGIEHFYEIIHPAAILKRREDNHFLLIAEVNSDIAGVIEIKDYEHIKLLFVDEKFQNKAIARSLIRKSIGLCREHKPDLTNITVNSSPNAVRIYEKLGFKQTSPEQLFKGIRFTPMVLELSEFDIKLIEPTPDLKAEFLAMAREFEAEGNPLCQGIGSIEIDDFNDSVERAKDHARGVGLPDGWVPAATYWLVRQQRLVGTTNLRYELNDFLREIGGHIGYSIRPSEQGKGYGTLILALTLEKAAARGLPKVLVTCDKSNVASRRVIEKNCGILENEVIAKDTGQPLLRYWIDLLKLT